MENIVKLFDTIAEAYKIAFKIDFYCLDKDYTDYSNDDNNYNNIDEECEKEIDDDFYVEYTDEEIAEMTNKLKILEQNDKQLNIKIDNLKQKYGCEFLHTAVFKIHM